MIAIASTKGLPHEKWLAYRRMGIGGSDASVICGVNKYKSPVELWMEKTGQQPDAEAGEAAHWGNMLEPLVRTEFSRQSGIEVIPVHQILQSSEYPFMLANLDGVCRHPEYGKCIFEAKTASAYKSAEWEGAAVPYAYVLQVQHYMAVTGYVGAFVAVLIGGNQFQWKYIERDEGLIAMLIRMEQDFWERVQNGVPPNLDGSEASVAYINKRYPEGTASSIIRLPDAAADLICQYKEACEQLAQVTEQKQKATNLLKQMLGANETGTLGDNIITWKNVSQERFDSKLFETEQPEIHERYMSKTTHRRFIVRAA